MATVNEEAQGLFKRYLECWNRRDLEGVAACFDEPSMFIVPSGAVSLPDRLALVAFLERMFQDLEAAGFSYTTIGSVGAVSCGNGLAVVDASDVQRIKIDGTVLEKIDGHYVMRNCDGAWRLIVATLCVNGWRSA